MAHLQLETAAARRRFTGYAILACDQAPLLLLTEEVEKQGEHTLNDRWADSPDYVRDRRDHQSEKFVLTGQAATKHAGPAVSLSFILAGITCAFTGLAMRNSLRPFR
ncbi:MAG TPA: hypothetical protein VHZ55_22405 [Bryobacteraceae bacterium]|nr:hypothetical protein [Bryobacteraceae bacterium]